MEFNGSNKKYKKMLFIGVPLAFILFLLGFSIQENEEFTLVNLMLFTAGGAAAGGLVGVPVTGILKSDKKVIITKDEVKLAEGKKTKSAKLGEIRDVSFKKNAIMITMNKDSILINGMSDYPLKEIHDYLNKQLDQITPKKKKRGVQGKTT